MSKLKIAVIISSTRPTRFGELPAQWIAARANERPELEAEILDLRDFDLPPPSIAEKGGEIYR